MTLAYHAMLFPKGPAVGAVEELRREWDPEMARVIGAHITAVYPAEHDGLRALSERVAQATAGARSFWLNLGGYGAFPPPDEGCVYLKVADTDGGFAALRKRLLSPRPLDFLPHMTIIHPRTSQRAAEFWRLAPSESPNGRVEVTSVCIVTRVGNRCMVERQYDFRG